MFNTLMYGTPSFIYGPKLVSTSARAIGVGITKVASTSVDTTKKTFRVFQDFQKSLVGSTLTNMTKENISEGIGAAVGSMLDPVLISSITGLTLVELGIISGAAAGVAAATNYTLSKIAPHHPYKQILSTAATVSMVATGTITLAGVLPMALGEAGKFVASYAVPASQAAAGGFVGVKFFGSKEEFIKFSDPISSYALKAIQADSAAGLLRIMTPKLGFISEAALGQLAAAAAFNAVDLTRLVKSIHEGKALDDVLFQHFHLTETQIQQGLTQASEMGEQFVKENLKSLITFLEADESIFESIKNEAGENSPIIQTLTQLINPQIDHLLSIFDDSLGDKINHVLREELTTVLTTLPQATGEVISGKVGEFAAKQLNSIVGPALDHLFRGLGAYHEMVFSDPTLLAAWTDLDKLMLEHRLEQDPKNKELENEIIKAQAGFNNLVREKMRVSINATLRSHNDLYDLNASPESLMTLEDHLSNLEFPSEMFDFSNNYLDIIKTVEMKILGFNLSRKSDSEYIKMMIDTHISFVLKNIFVQALQHAVDKKKLSAEQVENKQEIMMKNGYMAFANMGLDHYKPWLGSQITTKMKSMMEQQIQTAKLIVP